MTNQILIACKVFALILTAHGIDTTKTPRLSTGNGDVLNDGLSRPKAIRLLHNFP